MIAEAIAAGMHTAPRGKSAKHRRHHKHHPHVLPKPDVKVMAAVNAELGTKVDFDKLADFEGGQQLRGYIPGEHNHNLYGNPVEDKGKKVSGGSGVTIATGFDIGQRSAPELKKLGLSVELQKKYSPFCGTGRHVQAAIDALEKSSGLTIEKWQADETDMRVQGWFLRSAKATWNNSLPKGGVKFEELTAAQQTVILSRTYHQGTDMPHKANAKNFYSAAQKGDWDAAEKALRNYAPENPKKVKKLPNWYHLRVKAEADYLAQDLKKQKQAAPNAAPKVPDR